MTFLGLKMIIFGHFSRFLASFKISFSSLQHPTYKSKYRFLVLYPLMYSIVYHVKRLFLSRSKITNKSDHD